MRRRLADALLRRSRQLGAPPRPASTRFFGWLGARRRALAAWFARPPRDERCARCRVPFQAHPRELHPFEPNRSPP